MTMIKTPSKMSMLVLVAGGLIPLKKQKTKQRLILQTKAHHGNLRFLVLRLIKRKLIKLLMPTRKRQVDVFRYL